MLLTAISIITIIKVDKKEIKLDNVSLKEQINNMNGLAIMLEQDAGDYKESTNKSWPTEGYTFNKRMSKCIDNLGNKTENTLTYKNGLIYVETDNTSYCYIYFDIDRSAVEELLSTVEEEQLWDSTLEDDGYRYIGTNPDNNICFGTTDQEECMNDTDKYMYRIIGIFEDSSGTQHLKLIKKEALNVAYAWNADYQTDVDWDESDLYKGLNGSYFATNLEYAYMQDSAWNNIITAWEYTATNTKTYENFENTGTISGPDYYSDLVRTTYLHELNRSTKINTVGEWKTISSKISLMYVSDYQLSLGSTALDYINNNSADYASMKTGWIHLSNNDTGAPSSYEYSLTRFGVDYNGVYYAYEAEKDGYISGVPTGNKHSVRPVFYLESDTKLDKGTGTIDNPYTLEISPNLREYCEEYNNINECIQNEENNIEEVGDLWNSTLEEDGIRYVGTNPNNYVCFGTTNTNECILDTDKYMYRIIGIFEDSEGQQHLKLIKKEVLNSLDVWHSVKNIDIDWDESDLYKGLNESYFLTNSTYSYMQNSSWLNKITEWNYTATNTKTYENYSSNSVYGPYYYDNTVKTVYLHEMNRSSKTSQTCYYASSTPADCSVGAWKNIKEKISLMYINDYLLSLGEEALDYTISSQYSTLKTGWMHISNNDSDANQYEWTSSRAGTLDNINYRAYVVNYPGHVSWDTLTGTYSTRPVFYLTETIKITSGKGSITEPFIIN